ncbi:MAG: hypothetical protein AAF223_18155, partial [Bacteroidota bacterium]
TPPAEGAEPTKQEAPKLTTFEELFSGKTAEQVKEEYDQLSGIQEKYKSTTSELERLKNHDPFNGNEYLRKRTKLIQEGATEEQVNAFDLLNRSDLKEATPYDKLRLKTQLEYGWTADKADMFLKKDYKLSVEDYGLNKEDFKDEDGEFDEKAYNTKKASIEKDIEYTKLVLEKEAKDADKYLSDYKTSIKTPAEEAKELITQNLEKSKAVAQGLQEVFTSLGEININGSKDDPIKFDFQVSEEYRKTIPQKVEWLVSQFGTDVSTEQGKKELRDYLTRDYAASHYPELIQTAVNHAVSLNTKQLTDKQSNAKSTQRGDLSTHPKGGKKEYTIGGGVKNWLQ